MDLIITMLNGESQPVSVQPDTTVQSLKVLIHQLLRVPPGEQRLLYENGQKISLSDDSKTLTSYGLRAGSKVWVLRTEASVFQVFLKNEKGQISTHNITAAETVDDFKKKVKAREGVPVDQQRLIYEGRQMDNGKLTDYNVREGSTIYLTLRLRGG
ncbi:ubiquitin-like protein ISG15 [Myripristis murdjan]|uniref:ubiquitin-like protein ISG15 n=1 Tax=Myripristis murdjan TaxID=586833 RepID=UPI00117645E2|nr:polyubiquitin-like [Myripristis murdjan]